MRLGDDKRQPTWLQVLTVVATLAGTGAFTAGQWAKGAATEDVAKATDPLAARVERLDERTRWLEWSLKAGGCGRVDAVEQGPPMPTKRLPRLRPVIGQ